VLHSAEVVLENKTITEGQSFTGYLTFSDEEAKHISDLKALEGVFIFGKIYIAEILEVKGIEGLKVKFSGVSIAELIGNEKGVLEIEQSKIPIVIRDVSFTTSNLRPGKELLFYELSSGIIERLNKWAIGALVIFFIILICFVYKNIKARGIKKQIRKIKENEVSFWKEQIEGAGDRRDYEHIYLKRTLWKNILELENKEPLTFLNKLNEIQYKEEWSDFEKDELSRAFLKFKNKVIESNGI